MKVYDTNEIRNLAIVGHGDSGKTSLVSAMLFATKMVTRLGSVLEGTTATDWEDEEIDRKVTLSTGVAFCEHEGSKINLLDTPGYSAFIHEAKAAMRVAETAIVVVDAVSGVEVQTEKVWGYANDLLANRLLVINKLDRPNAEFERTLEGIQEAFGRQAIPVHLPIGSEDDFSGIVDLATMKAYKFASDASGKAEAIDIPGDLADKAQEARAVLTEMVAEADDALLEIFLDKGELSDEEFSQGLRTAVRMNKLFPVYCTSATKNIGVTPLLDAIVQLCPSPADVGGIEGKDAKGEPASREPSADGALANFVWKTISDPFTGKITIFRVYSGELKSDTTVRNGNQDRDERIGKLFLLQGKDHTDVSAVRAGDIGAIAKLKSTVVNDTLTEKGKELIVEPTVFPEPAISFAVEPKAKGDEEKIGVGLNRISEEDPCLQVHRDPQTNELLIAGTGQLHVEVAVSRLKRRFSVEVLLKQPKVPYRETITKEASASYRHRKQTGGAGQFAEVHMRIEPMERGGGFEYAWEVVGGAISQGFRPSIEKGIRSVMKDGIVAGCPVVDVRAAVYDGKEHPVDSKDVAFQIAAREAFKKCVMEAGPMLLEPVMTVEVSVPEESTGDVVGDLNSRRARVAGMEPRGKRTVVKCEAPLSEMLNYAPSLNSMTGGRGDFHMEFSHYQVVPANIQAKIVAEYKASREG